MISIDAATRAEGTTACVDNNAKSATNAYFSSARAIPRGSHNASRDACFPIWQPARQRHGTAIRCSRQGTGIPPLHSGFDADLAVDSEPELLLATKVMFRCLDGHMTEKKLDLVQFAAGEMAKTRACPP